MNVSRTRFGAIATAIALTAATVTTGLATSSTTLALPGASESTLVTVEPTRVLDTRRPVGLTSNLTAFASRKLTVTGPITTSDETTNPPTTPTKTVIPTGATGVIMNVTSYNPTGDGYISIRPGNATDTPATSNLNVTTGQTVPNSVTVALPTTGPNTGQIDITYGSTPGNTTGIIIDIIGYTTSTGLADLTTRIQTLETDVEALEADVAGLDNVITVSATGGDFTDPAAAMASITDASVTNPYVVAIGPGTYEITSQIRMVPHVHLQGSGRGSTVLTSSLEFTIPTSGSSGVIKAAEHTAITDLSLDVSGTSGAGVTGIAGVFIDDVIISDVDIAAQGTGTAVYGVVARVGSVRMDHVQIEASSTNGAATDVYGVYASFAATTVRISDSQIAATTEEVVGAGTVCVDVLDSVWFAATTFLDTDCE